MPKAKLKPVPICLICGKPITDQPKCSKVHKGECATLWQRERDKKKWAERAENVDWKQERNCIVCQTPFVPRQPHQASCDDVDCRKTMKRNRKQRESIRPNMTAQANDKPAVGNMDNTMDCPWATRKFDTLPPGVRSWDDPIMDPMSGGFPMNYFNAPVAQEVAA